MELKHSPAPWHLRDGINEGSLLLDDNYNVVALLSTEIKGEDANLIEAAPELLQVLQLIISYHDDGNVGLYYEDLALARKAIAKALGQQ